MKKIIAISGSLRKGSLNTMLLKGLQARTPDGYVIKIASIHGFPLYNNDDEHAHGVPKIAEDLKKEIIAADALLISTPEYNHGIPGVIKNALDWLTRPPKDIPQIFHNLKVGLVGASPSRFGTAFSQTAWLPILRYLNTHPYFGNQLFLSSANKAFNEQGELVDNELEKLLQNYIQGFCAFINNKN